MIAIKATVTALDIILAGLVLFASRKAKRKVICGVFAALIAVNAILIWY